MSAVRTDLVGKLFSLEGRSAIVTGASRGIGWALANAFAQAGAIVLAIARSKEPVAAFAAGATYRSCDVINETAVKQAVDELEARCGRVDTLVNAAGISIARTDLAAFDETLAVNLRGTYLCSMAVIPAMQRAGRGSIINLTSLGAHLGFPGNPAYCASKGGVRHLTRALAVDLGAAGIRANNLMPGYIESAMTAASYRDPHEHARRERHTILARWGTPDDLVGAAIFLASDASAYITGQDIAVDGGWTAKGLI